MQHAYFSRAPESSKSSDSVTGLVFAEGVAVHLTAYFLPGQLKNLLLHACNRVQSTFYLLATMACVLLL